MGVTTFLVELCISQLNKGTFLQRRKCQCLQDNLSDSKEEMLTIMTFSFFKWYFIFHVFIILFPYFSFSQNIPTFLPTQLSVLSLSLNKQTKKDNQPTKMTKNTKTKQQKSMESWNLFMLASYS